MFNPNMLLTENYKQQTSINNKVTVEESYFEMALKAVQEICNESFEQEKMFLATVLEAGDSEYLLNESFSTFVESIKKIIDKFLELIKSLAARFVTTMNSIVKSDKHLIKHKSDFDKFATEDEFKADIFKFTNIDNDTIPRTTAYAELVDFNLPPLVYGADDPLVADKLYSHINGAYETTKQGMNKWYDGFRARVLGEENLSYDAAEYKNKLFEFYHNNETSKKEETIDREFIINAYERFANYKKVLNDVSTIKRKLEAEYKNIRDNVKHANVDDDNMLSKLYPSKEDRTDDMDAVYKQDKKRMDTQINLIENLKVEKIKNMCSIHAMAFAAKLDAIKDCYKQDKTILYRGLKKIQKVHESTDMIPEVMSEASLCDELSYTYAYSNMLMNEATNQMKLIRCLEEADSLSMGIMPLQESVVDTIKATIQKIIATVRKIWAKFLGKVSEFVQSDKSWLDTNKSTILNQTWKDRTVELYIYDEAALTGDKFKVPQFAYNDFKEIALSENIESAFIKKYFGTTLNEQEGDIREQIINKLRTEEMVEKSISSIDKRDLFNFCINYENIANNLKKDILVIEKNQSVLNQELGKVENELQLKQKDENEAKQAEERAKSSGQSDEAKKAEADAQKAEKDAQNAQAEADKNKETPKNESAYLSLYEAVVTLNEAGPKIGKLSSDKPSVDNTATKGANINTGARDTGLNKDTAKAGAATQNTGNTENDINELNKLKQGAGTYFTCCSDIVMAKLTTCQRMYKDYMILLRAHVESYAGETTKKK